MNGKDIELVLLGYSAAESASIRYALSSLSLADELAFRCLDAVDQLPAALGDGRQRLVVANGRLAVIDIHRVSELCRQHASAPPLVFAAPGTDTVDGQVSGDPLDRLRRSVLQRLRGHRSMSSCGVSARPVLSIPLGEHLSSLLDISTDAVIATDHDFNVIFFNKGAERIFGYAADEIIGLPSMVVLPSFAVEVVRHCGARQAGFASGTLKGLGECGEIGACRRDGSRFPAEMSLADLDDCGSGGAVSLAILRDVGEKKRAVAQVEYLATHDSLTGLPNRRLFFERLARAIDIAEQDEKLMALMFIDLDGFKQVNDVFGHAAGDELLRVVAGPLRSHLRAADTVARLGGDEFAVIVEQLAHVDPISELASVLLRTVAEPIALEGATASVSASIGIVICPLEAKSCKQMMVDADRAMYAAKAAGKGRFLFYAADMMAVAQNDGGGAAPERSEATPARLELCA